MGLLDEYNQSIGDDTQAADPADIRKKRSELERQIVIAESDLKKILREKQDMENQQKRLKRKEQRLRIDRSALDQTIKKMQNDQALLEEEIKGLKKKLKVLI